MHWSLAIYKYTFDFNRLLNGLLYDSTRLNSIIIYCAQYSAIDIISPNSISHGSQRLAGYAVPWNSSTARHQCVSSQCIALGVTRQMRA